MYVSMIYLGADRDTIRIIGNCRRVYVEEGVNRH